MEHLCLLPTNEVLIASDVEGSVSQLPDSYGVEPISFCFVNLENFNLLLCRTTDSYDDGDIQHGDLERQEAEYDNNEPDEQLAQVLRKSLEWIQKKEEIDSNDEDRLFLSIVFTEYGGKIIFRQ